MKLHLPKKLTAALLAAVAATSAHAITTSTTTYADGTVFNGDIWTWNNYSDGTSVSAANSKFTNYSTGQQYAGDASLATIDGPDKFWKVVQFNSETEYVGNTLRFAGNPGNIRLNTDYNAWVWIGGIITEAGNSGTFTLGRDSSDFRLKGNHDVNLIIGSNFTLKSGSGRSTEIMTGGTWDVASGKTLTFTGKSLTFYAGQAVDITGGGTVVFDTPFTGQVGSRFTVGGDATLTFNQAATIGGTIANSGNVNFRGAVTLSDSLSGFDATGSYVDYNGDTAANGYAGALEYTIVSGTGNVEGLSTVTWNGTTKQVVNGKVTIGGAVDYSTYHLLTPGAELDLATELQRNSQLTTVSLSAGTTLHVNTDFGGTVEALGAASVDIASGKVFYGTLSGGVLQGTGTYALAADQSTLGSVSLGQGWTGAVRLSGSIADLKLDAAQLGNKVELMGVSGHFFALQADETTTYTGTLALNNAGASTPALLINNGYSRDNAYYQLAGAVEGGGIWRFDKGGNAVTNRIVFSGDVSAWNGALEVARGFNVDLTFAHRNGTVNAALSRSQGTLTVHVDEDTTFNAALSGVSEFTVAAGKTAALNADFSVSTVNLSGTLDLGGRSVEIATLTSANDAALLKNGTVTGDLAISGSNLTADGVRFTPATSLSVEDAGEVSFINSSTADSDGGAIYARDVSFTENGTVTFSGNSAAGTYAEGGAIHIGGNDVSFTGNDAVTFSGNSATGDGAAYGGAIYGYISSAVTFSGNATLTFSGNSVVGNYAEGGAIYCYNRVDISRNGSVSFVGNSVSSTDDNSARGGAIYLLAHHPDGLISLNENDSLVFDGNSVSGKEVWGSAITADGADLDILNNGEVVFTNNRSTDAQQVTAAVSGVDGIVRIEGNDHVLFRGNGFSIGLTAWDDGHLVLSAGRGQSIEMYDMMYVDNGTVSLNSSYTGGEPQRGEGDILISGRYLDEDYDWDVGVLTLHVGCVDVQVEKHTTHVDGLSTLYAGRLRIEDGAVYEGGGFAVADAAAATLALRNASMVMLDGTDVAISGGSTLELQGVNTITANTLDMQSGSAITFTVGEGNLATPLLTLTGTFLQEGDLILDVGSDGTAVVGNTYALLQTDGGLTPGSWNPDQIIVGGMLDDVSSLKWENGILYGTLSLKPELITATWSGAQSMAWNTTSLNWSQGEYSYRYQDGVDVVFDNAGAAGVVELQGEFSPASVLVDNDTEHAYTFSGEGRLTGDMQLTKDGEGTLTINTENDYTGGTLLSGGTLVMGNESAFGSGAVVMNGGTLDLGGGTIGAEDIVFTPGAEIGLSNGVLGYHGTEEDIFIKDARGVHADMLSIDAHDLTIESSGEVSFRASGNANDDWSIYVGNALKLIDNESVTFSGDALGAAICADDLEISRNGSVRLAENGIGRAIWCSSGILSQNGSLVFDGNCVLRDNDFVGAIAVMADLHILNNGEVAFTNNRSEGNQNVTAAVGGKNSGSVRIQGNDHVLFRGNGFGIALGWHIGATLALSAGRGQSIEMYDMMYVGGDVSFNSSYTDAEGNLQRGEGDILISGRYLDEDYDWEVGELSIHCTLVPVEKHTTRVNGQSTLYAGRLRIEDGAVYEYSGFAVADGANATLALRNASMVMIGYHDVCISSGSTLDLQGANSITAATLDMQSGSTLAFTLDAAHADTAILTLDGAFNQGGALTISLAADGTLQEGDGFLLMSLAGTTTPASWNKDLVTLTGFGADIGTLSWAAGGLYFTYGDTPLPDVYRWTGASSMTWNTSAVNWTYEGQGVAYSNGVDVAFGNDGCGSVELQGELAPASVLVNNGTGHGYTFTGSGKLTGDMQLTKDGKGTLAIYTANDYTGGTVLSGGTLVMGNGNAFGTGPIIMNGGTLDLNDGLIKADDIVFTPGAEIGLRDGSVSGDVSIAGGSLVADGVCFTPVSSLSVANAGNVSFRNASNFSYGAIDASLIGNTVSFTGNESVTFSGNSVMGLDSCGGAIYAEWDTVSFTGNGAVTFSGNTASYSGGAICSLDGHLSLNENDSLVFDGNSVSGDNAYGGAIALYDAVELQILNNGEVAFTNNRSADAQQVTAAVSGSLAWPDNGVRIQGNDHVLFRGNGFGIALRLWLGETFSLSAGRGQSIEMYDMMYVNSGYVSLNSSYTDAEGNLQRGEGDILISGKYLDEDYDWEVATLSLNDNCSVQVEKHTTCVEGLSTLYGGRLRIEDGAVYEGGGFAVAAGANATLALRNASMVTRYEDQGGYVRSEDVSISGGSTLDLQGTNSITAATLDMQSGSTLAFTLDAAHADTAILTLDGSFNQGGLLTISLAADGTLQEGDEFLLMSLAGATTPASWKKPLVTVTGLGANIGNLSWEDSGLYFTYGDIPLPDVYRWTGAGSTTWNTSAVNWTYGGQSVAYSNGVDVVFDNTGIGGEVELQGELAPASVLVDNDAEHGYTFTGSGKLTGDMLLTKAGTGTLTVNTENDYTGGTLLSGGTLVMGNENAFGTGPVIMNGGTLDLGGGHLNTKKIALIPGAEIGLRNGSLNGEFAVAGGSLDAVGVRFTTTSLTVTNAGDVSFRNASTIFDGGAIYASSYGSISFTENETVTFSGNTTFYCGGAIYCGDALLSLNENDSLVFEGNSVFGNKAWGGAIALLFADLQILNNGEVAFTNNRSADAQNVTAAVGGCPDSVRIQGNDHVLFRGNGFGIALDGWNNETLALSAGRGQSIEMYDMMYLEDVDVTLNSSYTDAAGNLQRGEGDILISGRYLDEDYDWNVGWLTLHADWTYQVEKHTTHVSGLSTLYAGRLSIEDGAVYEGGGFTVADAADATLALRNASMVMLDGKDVGISGGSTLAVQGVNSITAESLNMADGSTLSFTLGVENANEAALTLTGLFNQGGALTINLQSDIPDETCKLISMTSGEAPESWDMSRITLTGEGTDARKLQWEDGVLYYLGTVPHLETATWSGAVSKVWNSLDKNWTQGEYSYRYRNGVDVVFGNTGAAGEVELTGSLAPLGVLVDNDAEHGYAFTGSGKLTGDMQLTKDGAGTLSISTANDYTGGTVLNGGTLATASATALGGGDLLMQGGRLRVEQDLTLEGQITVNGLEDSSIEVADGAVLHLSQVIVNDGFIRLSGDIDISALEGTPTGTTYYGGGQTQGNGFLMTECETLLIECGLDGDFDWSGAEIHHSGNTVVKEDWGGVIFAVPDTDAFYIFKDTESVSTAHSFTPDTRIVMSAGTTLNVDADINLAQIQANGAATIDIDSGSVLTGYATGTGLTLAGDGVYALESGTTLGSLSLGSNWTGTVRLTGSASGANFNSMARTGSRLELNGVSGYPTTYNGTTTADIILTDTADGTAAFTATYGNSYNYGYNMKFTGAIRGEGTFVANAGANRYQNYELAGDVSGWRGEFRYASGQDTVLTVSGNAHEVNAAINGGSGLTLQVKTDSAFGAAVSAGSLVLNGGSATFNDSILVGGGISASGTSTLAVGQGHILSLGTAISNSGSLTLRGTFDVSGHESELIGSEYSGGAVSGNGFGATLYGVHAVQNSGSATLDWSQAKVLYDAVEREKRADGSVVLSRENDGMFHVLKGTESVGTAQDAAAAAGITMQGIELQDGTTLEVDRDFSTEPVSVVSGSAYLNVMAGATLQSNGEVREELSLKGDGTFKLAAGSTQEDISWDGADWHGTVLLSDVAIENLDLNEFGHAGSKVGLDGVSGNFARPGAAFAPTLVLTGDGLEITACYTGASYTFAGGVEGDGNWIYGLTGRTHNQTYIFTGDMSRWTGAYESVEADKTSTLKFYGDAAEMGADIRQTAGTVNVEVGNGSAEHTTAFKGEVEATGFTVNQNATAVLENKATVTGSVTVDGTLEVADGGSLALAEAAAMSVGNAYTVTGQGGNAPALSGNIKADAFGFHGAEDHTARIDNAIVDLQAEASVVFDNVILGATSRLTDDPATVVANNLVIEGRYGVNVQEGEPMTIKSGSIMKRLDKPSELIELDSDATACRLDITNVDNVSITGNCLTIDLSGMYPALQDYSRKFDWLGISLGSGDQVAALDTNMVVELKLNDRLHPRAYYLSGVGWGGADFVMPVANGENVGMIYINMFDVPEPTTSTLSLLALAALAARRRRKH